VMVGGVDLSVGPLAGLLVVTASYSIAAYRTPAGMAIGLLVVFLVALLAGGVNWLLVGPLRIDPLIATLITYIGFQGLAFTLRPLPDGRIDPTFLDAVRSKVDFVPVLAIVAVVVAIALDVWLRRARSGIRLRAAGSDATKAARVGLSVTRLRLMAYVGCALLVVPASLVLMTQAGIGYGSIGESYTLASFGAAFLGGAAVAGGRGSFVGAMAGAALITQINTVVQFAGLELFWQLWLLAGLTLFAVAFYAKSRSLIEKGVHA
jgi:ribose transport system ATP-binding protein